MAELTEGEGLSNRQAAEVLGVSKETVRQDRLGKNLPPDDSEQIEDAAATGKNLPPHVARASGENEWYTPPDYIKAALVHFVEDVGAESGVPRRATLKIPV